MSPINSSSWGQPSPRSQFRSISISLIKANRQGSVNGTATMIKKIISGGQTGVDRAALDVALELGIACGGWCPKGRKAKDGPIALRYPLQETPSDDYAQR